MHFRHRYSEAMYREMEIMSSLGLDRVDRIIFNEKEYLFTSLRNITIDRVIIYLRIYNNIIYDMYQIYIYIFSPSGRSSTASRRARKFIETL